jgi:regulatory protein YycI of two-component signal transduction system YycFG
MSTKSIVIVVILSMVIIVAVIYITAKPYTDVMPPINATVDR